MGKRWCVSGDKELLLLRESRRAMEKLPFALGVRRSLPIWVEAVSAELKSVGSKGRENQGGQFLSESSSLPHT